MRRSDGESIESPTEIRLMTALVLFGTFAAGAVSGIGVYRWLSPPEQHHHHPGPPPPMGLPLRELDLTPEQDAKAHAIIESHHAELEGILRETFPRVRAVNDRIEQEVRAILTPAQRTRLDELKARRPPPPLDGPDGPGGPDDGPDGHRGHGGPHGMGPGFHSPHGMPPMPDDFRPPPPPPHE